MNRLQRRFDELQERWVAGETLSPDEQRERLELAARDDVAAAELELYARAQSWLRDSSFSQRDDDARFATRALETLRQSRAPALQLVESATFPATRLRHAVPVWAALSAAAAAVLLLALQTTRTPVPQPVNPPLRPSRAQVSCQLASWSGDVSTPTRQKLTPSLPLTQGQIVSTGNGSACLVLDTSVRVCLANHSELLLASLDAANIRVEVTRGSSIASLTSRPPGHLFALSAGDVVATARGTIFALERRQGDASTEVTVLRGHVDVRNGTEHVLLATLQQARIPGAGKPLEHLTIASDHERRWLRWLDTDAPGPLGADAVVAPERTSNAPSGDRTSGNRTAAGRSASPAPQGAAPSREALLAAARKEAGLGNAKAARSLYRELLSRYPGPSTAAVLVVLGNLEADANAPQQALTRFNAYLRQGGSLEPEALHGKVRALRALGRKTEERQTIGRYLARYPNGFQAPALRKRLAELE